MAGAPLTSGASGAVRGLSCPSCGAAIVLRGLSWTQTVACPSCASVLDARDPNLAVLQRFERKAKVQPLIPLGARGEWRGAPHEVIGFQVRQILVDGVAYQWREYVLFNPYRGFRYLTEYDGHWNDVVGLPGRPQVLAAGRPTAHYRGEMFRHFQTARASTTFVLGEFPWVVRVGDAAETRDFVSPPRILSAEATGDEETWSLGEYVDGQAVWRAFKLPGAPPPRQGVYANQPSPHSASARSVWKAFGALAALLVLLLVVRAMTARNDHAFESAYTFDPARPTDAAFVTAPFELRGGVGNVVIEARTDLSNQWLMLNYALVNEQTGRAWDVTREVGYYSGRDSDGAWSEGSRRDRVVLGSVPGGRYFLRVEPEGPTTGRPVDYTLRVRRDVPALSYFVFALLGLLAPPVFLALRAVTFEQRRWAESDYAPADSSDDDE